MSFLRLRCQKATEPFFAFFQTLFKLSKNLLTKNKTYGILLKLKDCDEELQKGKSYRERAFGGSA